MEDNQKSKVIIVVGGSASKSLLQQCSNRLVREIPLNEGVLFKHNRGKGKAKNRDTRWH